MPEFYQIILNRKYLKKLTRFLEKYNYRNYHYLDNSPSGEEILFEVFKYKELEKHSNVLYNYGDVTIVR